MSAGAALLIRTFSEPRGTSGAADGGGGAPQLDANDRFCVDGSRLRLTSGTYGADNSTYQTEIADFSLIIAHGVAGSGPAWFEAKGKNGLIYEYGNTANSAYAAESVISANTQQGAVLPIDLNGDGLDDIVYPNLATFTWYYALATASGTYSGPYNTTIASVLGATVGSVNEGLWRLGLLLQFPLVFGGYWLYFARLTLARYVAAFRRPLSAVPALALAVARKMRLGHEKK